MDIKDVKKNLNKPVSYKSSKTGLDGIYILNACIIRRNEKGFYYTAELQQGKTSIIIVKLEEISAIEG